MTLQGFIDLHVHGAGKFETRTDDPSDILNIAQIHGQAGTGAVLLTIYPASLPEMRTNMRAVRKAMQMQQSSGARQNPPLLRPPLPRGGWEGNHPAVILGVHLEGPFLNPLRCGALDKGSFIEPTLSALRELIGGYEDIVKIITIAPELPGALKVIESCRGMSILVNMGHSNATYEEAENGKKAGATGITHLFNAMRPFHQREPGLAGLGLIDEDIYIEVIADGIHLHPVTLELIFNRKRLDRIILVSDSIKSVKGARPTSKNGVLAGSGITLMDSFRVLKDIGVPEAEIIEAAKDNPKRYLILK